MILNASEQRAAHLAGRHLLSATVAKLRRASARMVRHLPRPVKRLGILEVRRYACRPKCAITQLPITVHITCSFRLTAPSFGLGPLGIGVAPTVHCSSQEKAVLKRDRSRATKSGEMTSQPQRAAPRLPSPAASRKFVRVINRSPAESSKPPTPIAPDGGYAYCATGLVAADRDHRSARACGRSSSSCRRRRRNSASTVRPPRCPTPR